ncbi:MAG TPA: hypothetical protein VFN94_07525 [Nitrospiria bacterium]|nr:hypothetical protein [Nitrospiria bacterium]
MGTSALVLIVEDDPKTSNLLKVHLEREGYQTRSADGPQVVESRSGTRPR